MSTTYEKPETKPAPALPAVASRLAGLRTQLNLWFVLEGLAYVCWSALALAAISFLLDYFFRLDAQQRTFLLMVMGVTLVLIFIRRVVYPLSTPLSDDGLLLEVERRHPELAESLISAVQFTRLHDRINPNTSRAMVAATIERGAEAAQHVRFTDVLNSTGFTRNVLMLVVAFAIVVGLAAASSAVPHIAIWFQRNILLQSISWPQKTYLLIQRAENGVIRIPRGDDYMLVASVKPESEEMPERGVFIDFRDGRSALAMKPRAEFDPETSKGDYEVLLANVIQPFQFRVRGGDERTEWVRVELVEPPAVDELTLQITYPQYAGGHTETLPAGKGPYFVLPGASLQLTGKANKTLKKAVLAREGERVDLTLDGGRTMISGVLPAEQVKTGQYAIELTDSEGLTARRPTTFGLRQRADREPRVRAKLTGIGGMVTDRARLPLSGRVTDDHGLTKVVVPFSWRKDDEGEKTGAGELELPSTIVAAAGIRVGMVEAEVPEETPASQIPPPTLTVLAVQPGSAAEKAGVQLGDVPVKIDDQEVADPDQVHASLTKHKFGDTVKLEVQRGVASQQKTHTFNFVLKAQDVSFDDMLDLEPLAIPTNTGFSFFVSAADNDDYADLPGEAAKPNLGKSTDFTIRVVTDEELRSDLLRREKEQRQEFERLTKQQDELLTFSRELQAQLGQMRDLNDEQKQRLAQSPKQQKLIGTNAGGVTQRLSYIVVEIANNRLDDPRPDADGNLPAASDDDDIEAQLKRSLGKRVRTKIVEPLQSMQENEFPNAVKAVDQARRAAGDMQARTEAVAAMVTQQEATLAAMREILSAMAQAEGFQELVNGLYEVDKEERDVLNKTKKAKKEREEGILEGTDPSKKEPEEKPVPEKPAEEKP